MSGEYRLRINRPAVAGLHPPSNRLEIRAVIAEITVNSIFHHFFKGALYNAWGPEIHIGYPHRKAVIWRNAVSGFHHVPFA